MLQVTGIQHRGIQFGLPDVSREGSTPAVNLATQELGIPMAVFIDKGVLKHSGNVTGAVKQIGLGVSFEAGGQMITLQPILILPGVGRR